MMSSPSSLPFASPSPSWREQKVAHVSGHEGTTPQELLWVALVPPVLGTLFYGTASRAAGLDAQQPWAWKPMPHRALLLLGEVVAFFAPMILCQSELLYPYGIAYLALMAAATPLLLSRASGRRRWKPTAPASDGNGEGGLRGWVAAVALYRASLMVLTLIAILAVDFRVFPRRFAKTETSGHSLMDLGAASFVACAGIVSPRARRSAATASRNANARVKWRSRLLPVLFMGALRLVAHRSIDYPEHFTEYGVHWNFMFTLAALQVITQGVLAHGQPNLWVPVAIVAAYQRALDAGLQRWIETAPRTCARPNHALGNVLVANREGLFGCISYSCLFLVCEWVASRYLWNPNPSAPRKHQARNFRLVSLLLMALSLALEAWGVVTVSRRSTNAWFLLWVLAVNLGVLASLHGAWEWVARWLGGPADALKLPPVLAALSRHGFAVFVAANLLTGATNLSINTLEVSNAGAIAILLLYMVVNGILALLLDALLGSRVSTHV